MAPEILNESSYNKSVDLWAIGIMLYELLFGANPYNMQSSDLSPQEYKEIIEESDLIFPDRDLYDIEYSDQA
jgi:serine/threonine protein kinase